MSPQTRLQVLIEGLIAMAVIACCAGGEWLLLKYGAPAGLDGVVLGKILGTLDAAALIVLNYYFGSTRTSRAQVEAITSIGQAAANTPINITLPSGMVHTTTVASEAAKPEVAPPQQQHESHM